MKKEFKVGDKVALIATVTKIDANGDYKILAKTNEGRVASFTIDGRYNIYDEDQSIFHLEDLQSKPEFPKWMMVGDGAIMDNRYVIARHPNGKYIAIADAKTDSQLLTSDGTRCWKYAIDFPKELVVEEMTMEEVCKALGKTIKIIK